MLGTGGSQFPVSINLKKTAEQAQDDVDEYDEESQAIQGKMFVNQHMIKVCFREDVEERKGASVDNNTKLLRAYKNQAENSDDVISLKYTIDYPRVELHPFDTKKFQLFYADTKVNAKYDCNRCIEMRAANR